MTLRMSTRNSVTGWLPGVITNPCSRKRKPRMKISSPRRQIISAAARRLPLRSAARVAASTTPRPANQRNRGAAKPPSTVASRNAFVCLTVRRVHASTVCASIMRRTAIPLAQSTYARLWLDVMCGGEYDVLPHGVPYRAVLLVRQRDRARHDVGRDIAVYGDLEMHLHDAVRLVLSTVGDQVRSERAEWLPPLRQDVRHVHRHAARKGEPERLNGRRAFETGA